METSPYGGVRNITEENSSSPMVSKLIIYFLEWNIPHSGTLELNICYFGGRPLPEEEMVEEQFEQLIGWL